MAEQIKYILHIPELKVINANCISGPLTWGFPAISSFAGFVHAISRKLEDISLDGVGVVCHEFDPLVYKGSKGFEYRFSLSRNPTFDRDTKKPAGIVEEGRAHMKVSLLIGVAGDVDADDEDEFIESVMNLIGMMRIAGGSILPYDSGRKPQLIKLDGDPESAREEFRKIKCRLLPGFALIDRSDLMAEHLERMRETDPEANELDAFMDIASVKHRYDGESWDTYREGEGWLVPIPVGYSRISEVFEPGEVNKTRDRETHFCFVESAYSIGEWVSPFGLESFEDMLWFHDADTESGEYIFKHKEI